MIGTAQLSRVKNKITGNYILKIAPTTNKVKDTRLCRYDRIMRYKDIDSNNELLNIPDHPFHAT